MINDFIEIYDIPDLVQDIDMPNDIDLKEIINTDSCENIIEFLKRNEALLPSILFYRKLIQRRTLHLTLVLGHSGGVRMGAVWWRISAVRVFLFFSS